MVRFLLLIPAFTLAFAQARADGVFMVVKGDVKIEKSGKESPAKVGMKVVSGDTIIAGKDSRAKVVMKDKNILNISPESKIIIEKYVADEAKNDKNVVLNVLYGKVRSTVNEKYDGEKNKFHVKTPSAVAGVRGTDFITGYKVETRKAEFITFEGKVEVGQLGNSGQITNSVLVNPGQMTTMAVGGAPAIPSAVSKSELAKMENESKSEGGGERGGERQPANEGKQEGNKGGRGPMSFMGPNSSGGHEPDDIDPGPVGPIIDTPRPPDVFDMPRPVDLPTSTKLLITVKY